MTGPDRIVCPPWDEDGNTHGRYCVACGSDFERAALAGPKASEPAPVWECCVCGAWTCSAACVLHHARAAHRGPGSSASR